jgi:hypothetical protein
MAQTSSSKEGGVRTEVKTPEVGAVTDTERLELQNSVVALISSAQSLAYELATLDNKDIYRRDELAGLFDAAKQVVISVKRLHKLLQATTRAISGPS